MPNNKQKHAVFIFPGMGDDGLRAIRLATILTKPEAKKVNTDFYSFPFGWKVNLTPGAAAKRYKELKEKELAQLLEKYDSVSVMGISTGAALALLYALDNPDKVKTVVAYCGCIQYDEKYLDAIVHPGFKATVKKLDSRLEKDTSDTKALTKKVLVVHSTRDEIVPLKLQKLADAEEFVIHYPTHLISTTVGVIKHLTQGKSSKIWLWLTKDAS
jgi:alpha-beta hydrolase superfamily lysophospholipase